jgi:hypothetical protein
MRPAIAALLVLTLATCASEPEPTPVATVAVPPDRPLDDPWTESSAVRTAALIEAALAQVGAKDLRRCLDEFQQGGPPRFRPPTHAGWLIVASALPADGKQFTRRNEAAPDLNPAPADGWQDRVTYRGLLRHADPVDGTLACLSCVFDYEGTTIAYRHAYALDTCRRAVPPERDLAVVVPLR